MDTPSDTIRGYRWPPRGARRTAGRTWSLPFGRTRARFHSFEPPRPAGEAAVAASALPFRGYHWPLSEGARAASGATASQPAAAPAVGAATAQGYRWPVRTQARTARVPLWQWTVLTVFLAVMIGIFDFDRVFVVRALGIGVRGNDVVIAAMIGVAVARIMTDGMQLRLYDPAVRPFHLVMLAYAFLGLMLIVRERDISFGFVTNIQVVARLLPYFLTYFAAMLVMNSRANRLIFLRIVLGMVTFGSLYVLGQSVYGAGLPFGDNLLGRSFVPVGPQIVEKPIGIFHRSNFPIVFLTVWGFFFCLVHVMLRPRLLPGAAVALFGFAALLNMARGLYLGLALASAVLLLMMWVNRRISGRFAVYCAAAVALVLLFSLRVGFGDVGEIVSRRTISGITEYQQRTGTWKTRLVERQRFADQPLEGRGLLFGYGISGFASEIGVQFFEFGPTDLLYRGGLIGIAIVGGLLLWMVVRALRSFAPHHPPMVVATAAAVMGSLLTEVGHLPSANHFYYTYYAAAIGVMVAIMAVWSVGDGTATGDGGAATVGS